MGASGHPGDVEGSASMGDFVDDLACVLKHGKVTGKPVCIGLVPAFPQIGLTQAGSQPQVQRTGVSLDILSRMLTHDVVLVTIGVALSAGRLVVVASTSSRVSSPWPFP